MTECGDILFKGCTRPAMIFGVPMAPLTIVGGIIVLASIWIHIFITILLFPALAIMRAIAKHDDQQFRLSGLKILFRFQYAFQNGRFWKASAYSPIEFKKRNAVKIEYKK